MKISVIIVNHNHGKYLKKLLFSVKKNIDYLKYKFILIDNKPGDPVIPWIKNNYSWIMVYSNSKVKGFSENVNFGINLSTESKYILLINPDVILKNDTINTLSNYMDANRSVGVASPKLLNMDGTNQYSSRKFSDPITTVIRGLRLEWFPFLRRFNDNYLLKKRKGKEPAVDWVTGAFMMIRTSALNSVGLFDEKNFFMYSEDQDLCIRMWRAKWEVHILNNVEANHFYQRAGVKKIFSKYFYFQLTSTFRLFKKYNWKLSRQHNSNIP